MKTELYQNFFEHTAFPVFATDKSGKIFYKNSAANRFLPLFRKNSLAEKHFAPPEHPKKSMPVSIVGHIPYTTALALQNDDDFLFLAFSRLQYQDGKKIADRLLSFQKREACSLLHTWQNMMQEKEENNAFSPSRIHTDLLHLLQEQQDFSTYTYYLPEKITESVFSRLPHTFRALGYRIHTKIESDFQRNHPVWICLQDFLFIFEYLLYLQMRLSENKAIHISLTSDAENQKHWLRMTSKAIPLEKPLLIKDLIRQYIPEYLIEFLLLEKAGILDSQAISFRTDLSGVLIAEYEIDCAKRPAHCLRSVEDSDHLWEYDIVQMLERIQEQIKDNDASC